VKITTVKRSVHSRFYCAMLMSTRAVGRQELSITESCPPGPWTTLDISGNGRELCLAANIINLAQRWRW